MTDSGPGRAERLFVLPSPEALARAAAGRLWGIARERIAAGERKGDPAGPRHVAVALSGGKTPRRTYELLASEPYRGRFPWPSVRFFQTDERWVPAADAESNQRMIREALLSHPSAPGGSFHPVDTTLRDAAEAAARYEETLRAHVPKGAGGLPRFDAVLLGIGRDGHTASLFPGSAALREKSSWVAAVPGPDPGGVRVTLTLPVLAAAREIIFLVCGKDKAGILKDVLSPPGPPEAWPPASRVAPSRGRVTYLADAEAASLLPSPGTGTGR